MKPSRATQTTVNKSSDSTSTQVDSLDTISFVDEYLITDLEADDEADSDTSRIKSENLEQAITKAERELQELKASYEKVKNMKESGKAASKVSLKERLRTRPKSRARDGRSMAHRAEQASVDSETTSGVGRKRWTRHATTSSGNKSETSDADTDNSELEEIKRKESQIQEVIVKVESRIQDMRTILEKLILKKAQQKRENQKKVESKKEKKDESEKNEELICKTLEVQAKIKEREEVLKQKELELKGQLKPNINVSKNRSSIHIAESNTDKTKEEPKDANRSKDGKDKEATTKPIAEDHNRRHKNSPSRKKHDCTRSNIEKDAGKKRLESSDS